MKFLIFKIIGGILIVSSCFFIGFSKSKSLFRRKDFLESFILFINTLSTNFRYNGSDIFTLVSFSEKEGLFAENSFFNCDEKPFEEVWENAVSGLPKSYCLKKSDTDLLNKFGMELGKSDVEGQLKHLELYKSLFTKQLSDAEEVIRQKSKLYKTMGFFVGISIVLVIV